MTLQDIGTLLSIGVPIATAIYTVGRVSAKIEAMDERVKRAQDTADRANGRIDVELQARVG